MARPPSICDSCSVFYLRQFEEVRPFLSPNEAAGDICTKDSKNKSGSNANFWHLFWSRSLLSPEKSRAVLSWFELFFGNLKPVLILLMSFVHIRVRQPSSSSFLTGPLPTYYKTNFKFNISETSEAEGIADHVTLLRLLECDRWKSLIFPALYNSTMDQHTYGLIVPVTVLFKASF